MEAKELKFFKRYLKEEGLYSAFVKDAREQQDRRLGTSFAGYIQKIARSTDILMIVICWGEAKYQYWRDVYHEYQLYFNKNYK